MKVGDLVKLRPGKRRKAWGYLVGEYGIVYGVAAKGLKILMPDNSIKLSLVDDWEVVNEARM